MNEARQLDENDPKYYCCCGCCHVLTGAKIIGNIGIILTGLDVLTGLLLCLLFKHGGDKLIGGLLGLVFFSCLSYGISHAREGCLILFLVFMTSCIFGFMIYLSLLFIIFFVPTDSGLGRPNSFTENHENFVAAWIVLMGSTCLCIWMFSTVRRAYTFIKRKRLIIHLHQTETVQQMNNTALSLLNPTRLSQRTSVDETRSDKLGPEEQPIDPAERQN